METDEPQLYQYSTPQSSSTFKRPRRSLQSSTPLSSVSESVTSSPRHSGQSHLSTQVIDHINALKHLDDHQILLLLQAARNGEGTRMAGADRSSMSTMGSRASSYLSVPSSRVPSMLSDPRSSIDSSNSSYTHYSAASSRLSTASSRLSTISTASTPAPKNFACTFCDKALKSKPYWKSHEEEFHEQRLTWRCPDCEQIFHAGKRFREHHTKLHGCEHCKQPRESGQPTSRKASPCVKKYEIVMHDKDAWGCGFCGCLLTTWEERCEHIALHFEEKGNSKWSFTNVVLGLLRQPELADAWHQLLVQRHGEEKNGPTLAWESKRCSRLRYKLETKWDTRAFDVEKLVQDTYNLAEIEEKEVVEPPPETTPELSEPTDSSQGEMVEFKLETPDFGTDSRLQSSHGLPPEHTMMDLDPVEATPTIHHQSFQQPHWTANSDMSQHNMSAPAGMDNFTGFDTTMSTMTTEFPQPTAQTFQQQHAWPNAGFASTPDLLNFQQPTSFMNYDQHKDTVPVPTSQYAHFSHYSPRQSLPPNFLQQQQHASTPTSRRYVPKLINISNGSHRTPQNDQPPPPPPKDENPQQNRFSRLINMRRRPSNMSQHSLVSQHKLGSQHSLVSQHKLGSQMSLVSHRDIGWDGEMNWG